MQHAHKIFSPAVQLRVMQIAVYALQPRPECLEGRENGEPLARESCGVFTGTISISRVFGWVRGISVIKARPIHLCRGRVYYIYDAKGCSHTHTHIIRLVV